MDHIVARVDHTFKRDEQAFGRLRQRLGGVGEAFSQSSDGLDERSRTFCRLAVAIGVK